MNIPQRQIEALMSFGCTGAEARFLVEFPSKVPNPKVCFETYWVPKQPGFQAKDDEGG
jgi:hypothetical protein